MIGYFPTAYPDELIYSVLARTYIDNGFMIYREFAEEIFENKKDTPSVEFIGKYQPEVIDLLCKSYNVENIEELVHKGSQYSYYTRFYSEERKKEAMDVLIHGGNIFNVIRPSAKCEERHLRYCKKCLNEDRKKFGETYWHRIHQLKGIDCCPEHGIRLSNSTVIISGSASPNFVSAESVIDLKRDGEVVDIVSATEKKIAKYNQDLLEAPNIPNSAIDVIKEALYKRGYYSVRGMKINLKDIESDLQKCFYDYSNVFLKDWQISKILRYIRYQPIEISALAVFLNIDSSVLFRTSTFNIDDRIAEFDKEVMRLKAEGVSVVESAKLLGMNKKMISQIRNGKRTNERKSVRGKGGTKGKDWEAIDKERLPEVVRIAENLREKEDERPIRITCNLIASKLDMQARTFLRLTSCRNYVEMYKETQEEYWARQLVWAVKHLENDGRDIYYTAIRRLLNVRPQYLVKALPYIKEERIKNIISNITKAVG